MKTFDPVLHVYKNNLVRIPGATDIIKSEGLINPAWMSDEARWRGSCVHRGIELINKGELDWDTVDDVVKGYLKSYESFIKHSGFVVVGAEKPVFDVAYGCIPDIWGRLNHRNVVIECKTGPIPKWAAIQTALQKRALRIDLGFNAVARFGLRLMADGSISRLDPFDDPRDEHVAMSMLESFWWKKESGYIENW